MLLFATSLFAQDSTRTRDRDNFQNKEQKKEQVQKQEKKQDRFVDLDGDGINDAAMKRFQRMIKGGQHIDGNTESGQGEMNRTQKRMKSGTGNPLGDPNGTQTKKGTKGKK